MDTMQKSFFVGPLNLNGSTRTATTVMGAKLQLNEHEFEALCTLAANEGSPVSFERLYTKIWEHSNQGNRVEALQAMSRLRHQVEINGSHFMWIDRTDEENYTFITRWGHNWKTQPPKPPPAIPVPIKPKAARPKRDTVYKKLLAGAGLIAASLILAVTLMHHL